IHMAFINNMNDPSVFSEENPVTMIPLYEDDFVLVTRPGHPLTLLPTVSFSDLQHYQILFMGQKTSISKHMSQIMENHLVKRDEFVEINSIPGIKEMLKKTDMITFFPRLVVKSDLESHELTEVPVAQPVRSFITYLACQHNEMDPHLLQVIKETVESTIQSLQLPCKMLFANA
ncbi:MAG: transcriptional regulator, LysR family, partial [Brevibacillus sp.]|nr:transcriptional regulator, LysR family [Brevibacillus sp.]